MAYASRKPVVRPRRRPAQARAQPEAGVLRPADDQHRNGRGSPAHARRGAARAGAVVVDGEMISPMSAPPSHPGPGSEPGGQQTRKTRSAATDRSALVCCHEPSYLEYLTGQLRGIGYKVHHAPGAPARDQAGGGPIVRSDPSCWKTSRAARWWTNALWQHIGAMPTDERRQTYVVMLCQSFDTGDEKFAFALGLDQLINYQDIGSFAQLVVPPIEEHIEGNRHFTAALRKGGLSRPGVDGVSVG